MAYFHIKTKHSNGGRCSFITTSEILSSDRAFHSNNVLNNTIKTWKQPSIIALRKRCYEKHSWETLMPKCDFSKVVQLKSHFGMGVLLHICCIFSEHLFVRTPMDGYFRKKYFQISFLYKLPLLPKKGLDKLETNK